MAATYSAIRSPACSPTMVTPRIVLAGHRQHLDEAMRLAVGNGAVEIVNAVHRDFVRHVLFLRLLLVQADARHFRLVKVAHGITE